MKAILSLLIQLSILAAAIAPFLVPYIIASTWFKWDDPFPVLSGFIGLGIGFYVFWRWIIYHQKIEEKVVTTLEDPLFGKVQCLRDTWETVLDVGGIKDLAISGNMQRPTPEQIESFQTITKQLTKFLTLSAEAARDVLGDKGESLSVADLVLESIWLDDKPAGSFSLTFDAPKFKNYLKWGLSVDFFSYEVENAEDLH